MERYHQVPCGRRKWRKKLVEQTKDVHDTAGKTGKTYDNDREDDHEG